MRDYETIYKKEQAAMSDKYLNISNPELKKDLETLRIKPSEALEQSIYNRITDSARLPHTGHSKHKPQRGRLRHAKKRRQKNRNIRKSNGNRFNMYIP